MRLLRPTVLLVLAAACSDSTAPVPAVTVRVTAETVVASRQDSWLKASIPFEVTGSEADVARLSFCGISLQQRVGDAWQEVWGVTCDARWGGDSPFVAGPRTLQLAEFTGVTMGDSWGRGVVDGTYRLAWGSYLPGKFGFRRSVTHYSNGFELRLE
jgi:hypothetical protein